MQRVTVVLVLLLAGCASSARWPRHGGSSDGSIENSAAARSRSQSDRSSDAVPECVQSLENGMSLPEVRALLANRVKYGRDEERERLEIWYFTVAAGRKAAEVMCFFEADSQHDPATLTDDQYALRSWRYHPPMSMGVAHGRQKIRLTKTDSKVRDLGIEFLAVIGDDAANFRTPDGIVRAVVDKGLPGFGDGLLLAEVDPIAQSVTLSRICIASMYKSIDGEWIYEWD